MSQKRDQLVQEAQSRLDAGDARAAAALLRKAVRIGKADPGVLYALGRAETLCAEVADGTTLWDAARAQGLPVATSCNGESLCARCGLLPLEGADALSAESPAERLAKERGRVDPGLRLSCQARIHGDVLATARYW